MINKRLPPNKSDARYRFKIDDLRAMAWHQYVAKKSGDASNYKLDAIFKVGQTRWAAYQKGRQPSDPFLDLIDSKILGSKDVYLAGPDELKLWNALVSKNLDDFELIVKISNRLDAELIKFRASIMFYWIQNESRDSHLSMDWYDSKINYFKLQLSNFLGDSLADKAIELLEEALLPYISNAIAKSDFSSVLAEDIHEHNKIINESLQSGMFDGIQMSTVKNKGAKKKSKIE